MNEYQKGSLRIWWNPQIPGPCFYQNVSSAEEGALMLLLLADYDIFQYENNIKPDYANTGGLEVYEDNEWCDWFDEKSDRDDVIDWYHNVYLKI